MERLRLTTPPCTLSHVLSIRYVRIQGARAAVVCRPSWLQDIQLWTVPRLPAWRQHES